MSNLTDFIGEIKTQGLMRTANYSVEISPPMKLRGSKNLERIQLFCDSINIPGVNIASIANRSYGETREAPYEKQYGTITLTFFVDTAMETKKFFDSWIDSIQNPFTRNFEYYNNYATNLTINVEDIRLDTQYSIVVSECYPKSIVPIQIGYASTDVMKLEVEFNYKYWQAFDPKESILSPSDYNLGYDVGFKNDYFKFQSQFNSFTPETNNIFTGTTWPNLYE